MFIGKVQATYTVLRIVSEILAHSHMLRLVMANSEPVSEATIATGAFIPVNG